MSSPFEELRRTLNALLIRSAQLDVGGKSPEEISLGEVLGNLDALGCLILLVALLVALIVGFCAAMFLDGILAEPSSLYLRGAILGGGAGFLTCYFLFRLRRR